MIQPLGKNLLIKYKKTESQTSSGFLLAEKKKDNEAVVVAIGSEVKDVQVGQTILLRVWGGEKIDIDREEHRFITTDDVLAVVV
jgi:co-chaperonin GroES (HSP10)